MRGTESKPGKGGVGNSALVVFGVQAREGGGITNPVSTKPGSSPDTQAALAALGQLETASAMKRAAVGDPDYIDARYLAACSSIKLALLRIQSAVGTAAILHPAAVQDMQVALGRIADDAGLRIHIRGELLLAALDTRSEYPDALSRELVLLMDLCGESSQSPFFEACILCGSLAAEQEGETVGVRTRRKARSRLRALLADEVQLDWIDRQSIKAVVSSNNILDQ